MPPLSRSPVTRTGNNQSRAVLWAPPRWVSCSARFAVAWGTRTVPWHLSVGPQYSATTLAGKAKIRLWPAPLAGETLGVASIAPHSAVKLSFHAIVGAWRSCETSSASTFTTVPTSSLMSPEQAYRNLLFTNQPPPGGAGNSEWDAGTPSITDCYGTLSVSACLLTAVQRRGDSAV